MTAAGASAEAIEGRRTHRTLMRRSLLLSALAAAGTVTGFAATTVVAAIFGLGRETDALYAAYTVPYLAGALVNLAATSALVPAFARALEEGEAQARRLLNAVIGLVAAAAVPVALAGAAFPHALIGVITPGFDEGTAALAASMARVLFVLVPCLGVFAVAQAYLYARRRFAAPTLLIPLGDVLGIAVTVALVPRLGIVAASLGFLTMGLVQGLGALALVARDLRPRLDLGAPGLAAAGALFGAVLAGSGARRAVVVVERFLASFLPAGTLTALTYGNQVTLVVGGVFFNSLTAALLPDVSARLARGEGDAVRRDVAHAARLLILLALPLTALLLALREPLVRLLFQRGQFTSVDAALTAAILGWYLLSLPFMGAFRLVQSLFYAAVSTRTASVLLLAAALTNVALDVVLVRLLGAPGIPLAFAISMAITAILGIAGLRRTITGLPWKALGGFSGRVALASAALAGAASLAGERAAQLGPAGAPGQILALIWGAAAGALAFAAAASALGVVRIDDALDLARARLRRPAAAEGQR